MKKINLISMSLLVAILMTSCKSDNIEYSYINGEKVDSRFIYSGFYLDRATMSDTLLSDALDRVVQIDKPNPLGEVELPDISKIEIETSPIASVSEADVEAYMEEKRDRAMEYKTIKDKRGAKLNDKVVVDMKGYYNGEKVTEDTGLELILGSGSYEDIENGIIGHSAGEQFDLNTKMPDTVEDESLKGKTIRLNVTINYIQEPITPEIDEEFIKMNTRMGSTTLEEYKKEIRSILEAKAEYSSNQDVQTKLLNMLLSESRCTPSELGLAWKFAKLLLEQKRYATIQNITLLDMLSQNGDPRAALYSYKYQAVYTIGTDMVLQKIANLYNVTVGEDDKVKWYDKIALVNEYGSDVNYKFYHDSMGDVYVYDNAYQDKVLTELMKHIKIKFVEEQSEE